MSRLPLGKTSPYPSTSDEENLNPAAAPVAKVYIQVEKGVNVFTANAAGQLTLIKGSPFATVGQMEGVNGRYLISVGNTIIRAYQIESNGAIGRLVSGVNTQNYSGSECGTAGYNGAVLFEVTAGNPC